MKVYALTCELPMYNLGPVYESAGDAVADLKALPASIRRSWKVSEFEFVPATHSSKWRDEHKRNEVIDEFLGGLNLSRICPACGDRYKACRCF